VQKTTDLAVAGRARNLAVTIYGLTGGFPSSERYGLTAQMRRAVVSIGSNIAEGCGRDGDRALIAFLQIAMGSASELDFQLRLASDLGMASAATVKPVLVELGQLMRMLRRLILTLRAWSRRDGAVTS
jgi:four helix bundle protein